MHPSNHIISFACFMSCSSLCWLVSSFMLPCCTASCHLAWCPDVINSCSGRKLIWRGNVVIVFNGKNYKHSVLVICNELLYKSVTQFINVLHLIALWFILRTTGEISLYFCSLLWGKEKWNRKSEVKLISGVMEIKGHRMSWVYSNRI